jgi:hypothetical protein
MSMTRQQIKVHVQGVGEISIILLFSHWTFSMVVAKTINWCNM